MSSSEEGRTIAGWRTASRLYRKPPGLGWLLALLAIPLLLALLGWGALDKSHKGVEVAVPSVNPSATLSVPSATAPNANVPGAGLGSLSILRNGNDITLSGDLPDLATKTSLLDTLKAAFGPDVNLIDNLNIKAGVNAPDLSALGAVLKAAVDIPDFGWKVDGDTITLIGTAPSEDVKAAVAAAAATAWPNVKIDNQIQVVTATPAPATPAPAAPAPGGACSSLQADITALLSTPINFDSDGFTLAASSQPMLTQVADKVKGCPDAKIAVNGYTDSSGNDTINIPLSGNRAKSVADFLVSQGLAAGSVTSQGLGSADPIASNDTPDGKAKNRRVEITVS
jgi:peptidoglycan-binding protein ArfA